MAEAFSDNVMYAEMVKPHESVELANEALAKFAEEVYKLRCKFGLADVSIIVKDSIVSSGNFMWNAHFGNELEQETMAAWHLGRSSGERQDFVRKAMEIGSKEAISLPKKRK